MPTVLLEQIIQLLSDFFSKAVTNFTNILLKLNLIEEDTSNLESIKSDSADIKNHVRSIDISTATTMESTASIDGKLTSTNNSLSTVNNHLSDINSNTGNLITPVNSIKTNTDTIKADTTTIKNAVSPMANQLSTINANVGIISAFSEDIASNTLNSYNRLVTISSDTTQIRANGITTNDILSDIYDLLNGQIDYGGLIYRSFNINHTPYTT